MASSASVVKCGASIVRGEMLIVSSWSAGMPVRPAMTAYRQARSSSTVRPTVSAAVNIEPGSAKPDSGVGRLRALEADHAPCRQIDDGLVDGPYQSLSNDPRDLGRQLARSLLAGRPIAQRVEDIDRRPAVALAPVQSVRRPGHRAGSASSRTAGQAEMPPENAIGGPSPRGCSARSSRRWAICIAPVGVGMRHQDCELVAADAEGRSA